MAFSRKIVRVFIASPGDLRTERHIARDVAIEINQLLGDTFGIQIEMVGWEETIGSMGRPQELINNDLKRCELFIGIIWKRWGTPPDLTGKFTSGFEEEFHLAKDLYSTEKKPQLSMFFKDVSEDLLRDPGADLQKVLKFKNDLIDKKEILFMTFLDDKEFEKKLRKRLISYITELHDSESSQQEVNTTQSQSEVIVEDDNLKPLENKYFKSETISFLKKITKSVEFNGINDLLSHQIAYLRLLSVSMKKSENSDTYLEAHDANLIYLYSDEYSMGVNEKSGLIRSGINNFNVHNVPIWKWLELDKNETTLELYTLISKGKNKANAINAMITLNQPISNFFSREIILKEWFNDDNIKLIKISALQYLSLFGTNEDLSFIENEILKNDTSTIDLAIEAMICIVLNDSVSDAFNVILKYQPVNVTNRIINLFKNNAFYITFEQLKQAVIMKCEIIRIMAFDVISNDYSFDEDLKDKILQSEFMDLKINLLTSMAKEDFLNAKSLANKWLVYKDNNGVSQQENYNKFINKTMHYEERSVVEKIYSEGFRFDGIPLLALAKKNIDIYTQAIKSTIDDGCAKHFQDIISKYPSSDNESLKSTFNEIEVNVKKKICILYSDWIASRMDKNDFKLMRAYLKSDNSLLSYNLISYFSRFGEWCDVIDLVRYDKPSTWSLLDLNYDSEKIKDLLCQALIKLSSGKITELLLLNMDEGLKKRIISKVSKASINRLSIDNIINLMNDSSDSIREAICIKYVNCASKEKIILMQSMILAKETYFYNVIHWLDMGVSLKKEWSLNASNRLLGLL